jgi:hypothetical protein
MNDDKDGTLHVKVVWERLQCNLLPDTGGRGVEECNRPFVRSRQERKKKTNERLAVAHFQFELATLWKELKKKKKSGK